MKLLVTTLFALFMVSCVSTTIDENPKEEVNPNTSKQTSNDTSNETDTTNTTSEENNAADTDASSTADISADSSNNTNSSTNLSTSTSTSNSIMPPVSEDSVLSSVNISQLLASDDDSEDWEKFRQAYVIQYLKEPKYITYAMEKPLSKEVADYLYNGYGIHWSFIQAIDKDVEQGFFAARVKNLDEMASHLERLGSQGKGKDYYKLAYIAAWAYSKNGDKDKARTIITEENLIESVNNFALDIPESHLLSLEQSIQN